MANKDKPVFIMVPRKLVIAWIVSFICMLIMTGVSVQWANYVDRRSNRLWCGIVVLFDDTYKEVPPPTKTGKMLAVEFHNLRDNFRCK